MLNAESNVRSFTEMMAFYENMPATHRDGINSSPFQMQNWQMLLFQEFIRQRKPGKHIGAILYRNQEPVVGGHFFYKTTGKRRGLFILGTGGETDYNDLICFQENVSLMNMEP